MERDATIAPQAITSLMVGLIEAMMPGPYRIQAQRRWSMDYVTLVGLLAGTLTTIAFIPQLQQTWRTRSAQDVSLGMLITFVTGVFLWLVYGLMLGALPVILANVTTLVLTLAILILKMRYRS